MSQYIRAAVRAEKGYHLASHAYRVKLNQNENPRDLPPEIKERILARLRQIPFNRYYSYGADSLRQAIAQHVGWPIDGIGVGNGSNELLKDLVLATAVGGTVLTLAPAFGLYSLWGRLFAGSLVEVPLGERFQLQTRAVLEAMERHRPALILLDNPNVPPGASFPRAEVLQIVQAAQCLVVIDEAYLHYAPYHLAGDLAKYPNLVLLRTFSKAFSLAGLRLGYFLAHVDVAKELRKVVTPFSVDPLCIAVAETVLSDVSFVQERVQETLAERERLYRALREIPGVSPLRSDTNFISFAVSDPKGVFQRLLDRGVLIRDISGTKRMEQYLRVTVGTPEENQLFLWALRESI